MIVISIIILHNKNKNQDQNLQLINQGFSVRFAYLTMNAKKQ